jgi:hypothetical protein
MFAGLFVGRGIVDTDPQILAVAGFRIIVGDGCSGANAHAIHVYIQVNGSRLARNHLTTLVAADVIVLTGVVEERQQYEDHCPKGRFKTQLLHSCNTFSSHLYLSFYILYFAQRTTKNKCLEA